MRGFELASDQFLEQIRGKGRTIEFAVDGSDDLRYLDWMSANANVGGELLTHILLREEPRKIEVWEEFLHGTQFRCGLIDKLGLEGAEAHVTSFMIRHRRLLRLSAEDVEVLSQLSGNS